MFIIESQFYEQQYRLFLVNRMCGSDWSALLRNFWHITMMRLKKLGLSKLCTWINGFILQNQVFI